MSDRLYVGTRKGLFTLDRSSSGWSIVKHDFSGVTVPMLLPADNGTVYAGLGHGHFGAKFHRSKDRAQSWQELDAPAYPPMPEGREPDKCPMRGIEIPWRTDMIWELTLGGDGTLWCGTIPGGLFKSPDGGESWTFIDALWNVPERAHWMGGGYDYAGLHSVAVHPDNPSHVTVAVSCGGVWVTEDAGESWTLQGKGQVAGYMPPDQQDNLTAQDPHRLVACPGNHDALWIQHHSGIFRSTTGANGFSEIKEAGPSTFGFAVAVHPNDGDTAWFVPAVADADRVPAEAKVVVTRTRDGGQSFDVLTEGLPQEHAYDITFRHALDVDASGSQLAFGSSTGSLWTSDDQGDSWQTVNTHLPQIYCVRFADE